MNMSDQILDELLSWWREKKEVKATYLLPTSTTEKKDILLLITTSSLSYFDRLDLYYPPAKRSDNIRVYPITCEELNNWPEQVQEQVKKTLNRAKVLFSQNGHVC